MSPTGTYRRPARVTTVTITGTDFTGASAVKFATGGKFANGSTAIKRKPGKKYQTWIERTELRNVAKETRHMPDAFINAAGNDVTPALVAYAAPIVGPNA